MELMFVCMLFLLPPSLSRAVLLCDRARVVHKQSLLQHGSLCHISDSILWYAYL